MSEFINAMEVRAVAIRKSEVATIRLLTSSEKNYHYFPQYMNVYQIVTKQEELYFLNGDMGLREALKEIHARTNQEHDRATEAGAGGAGGA